MKTMPEPHNSLFAAIRSKCGEEQMSKLLQKGADPNCFDPNTGGTLLYVATLAKRVGTVDLLLLHGANPNQKFTYRSPVDGRVEADCVALHFASTAETATALIRAGADVNIRDASGTTPLMRAAFRGQVAVVNALLDAGASPLVRQHEQHGHRGQTARELAESKINFFRETICDDNRAAAEQRLNSYSKVREMLLAAERKTGAAG